MLQESADSFLEKEFPVAVLRELEASETGFSQALWERIAQLGWLGLALPEQYGGEGLSLVDLAVLVEEMGKAAFLAPFQCTITQGALPILWFGSDQQKQRLLPAVAQGQAIMSAAVLEEDGVLTPFSPLRAQARKRGSSYVLSGTKLMVEYAHVADYLLCLIGTGVAGREGATMFLVPRDTPGLVCAQLKATGGDRLCEVVLSDLEVEADAVIGAVGGGWQVLEKMLDAAAALQCVETAGLTSKALEMTLGYIKTRQVFGRPLGQFQVPQHHTVNAHMACLATRLTAYEAVWTIVQGLPARKQVAVAKLVASDSATEVGMIAHKLHGGIGITDEYDLHFFTRRAKGNEFKFGMPREHLEVVATSMGL